jgi:hypothetical protein
VAADLPSRMGSAASRASNPTHKTSAGPYGARSASPHAKVSPTDFHLPKVDAYAYGPQYRSPEDMKPIDTLGFTVTFPLRLP